MNPSKLADEILKRIENEKIKPRSKYFFIAQNISFWGLFALALIIGSISFAIILYATLHTDFAIGDFVENQSLMSQWISLLPLVWMLAIGIAIGLGIYGLKHTKRGYRIAVVTLVGGNIITSIALGSGLYAAGGAEIIEDTLESNFESYESVREKHQRFWGNPKAQGRLAGKVIAIDQSQSVMTLEGPRGNQYQVPFGKGFPLTKAPEVGEMLKMKGRLEGNRDFRPERMRSAKGLERIQRRIEDYRQQNPEARAQVEAKLSAETKAELEAARAAGVRPNRDLSERIRTEIEQNTTEEERAVIRQQRLENFPILQEKIRLPRLEQRQERTTDSVDNLRLIR